MAVSVSVKRPPFLKKCGERKKEIVFGAFNTKFPLLGAFAFDPVTFALI